jgi:hypothetical protein
MLLITWPSRQAYLKGWNDFLQFYAGGRLAFTDQLYNPVTVAAVQVEASAALRPERRFVRLPHYAILLWPLSHLPYLPSYALWQLLNLIGVVGAVYLWPYSRSVLAHTFAVWLPLYWSFINGQDLGLMLFGMVAVIREIGRPDSSKSGLALASCLIKYHLIWLAPVALFRRNRAMLTFLGVTGGLLVLGFAINPGWLSQYYQSVLLGRSVISKTPYNLFPLLGWWGLLAGMIVAAVLVWRCKPEIAFAGSIAVAVAVSPHAYIQDYTLVAPLAACLFERLRAVALARNSRSLASERPAVIGEATV